MNYEIISNIAINSVIQSKLAYCKFLSANDTGESQSHQAGIYVTKEAAAILFEEICEKGHNFHREISVKWQDHKNTICRASYYGKGTRNEYRITRTGQELSRLSISPTGSLFILTKITEKNYEAFVLDNDADINQFLSFFSMSPTDTGKLIHKAGDDLFDHESISLCSKLEWRDLNSLNLSSLARSMVKKTKSEFSLDNLIIQWLEFEYKLRNTVESLFSTKLDTVQTEKNKLLQMINWRQLQYKISLPDHFESLLKLKNITFSKIYDDDNRFVQYLFTHINGEEQRGLMILPVCKDSWKFINPLKNKAGIFVFTLQQGMSFENYKDIQSRGIQLIVPKPYIKTYPPEVRNQILSIQNFFDLIQE